jgi:hypothetical protein
MNPIHQGTMSETRVWARQIVDTIIAEKVHGPVGCLAREDVLELRKILRQTVPIIGLARWQIKMLREEFRAALGHPYPRRPKMRRRTQLQERDILPSMRPCPRKNGLLNVERIRGDADAGKQTESLSPSDDATCSMAELPTDSDS